MTKTEEVRFQVTVTDIYEMEVTEDMRNLYEEQYGADGGFNDSDIAEWMFHSGYSEVIHVNIGSIEKA